jgi:hypothetical protein
MSLVSVTIRLVEGLQNVPRGLNSVITPLAGIAVVVDGIKDGLCLVTRMEICQQSQVLDACHAARLGALLHMILELRWPTRLAGTLSFFMHHCTLLGL